MFAICNALWYNLYIEYIKDVVEIKNKFLDWLNTFLEEKNPTYEIFEIEHKGCIHYIDSEQVVDLIKQSSNQEQTEIKNIIVKIDFKNGDVNHFFKHLATGYIKTHF